MSWDKHNTIWVGKFAGLSIVWYATVVSLSFAVFAHWPWPSYYVLCVGLVCFSFYQPLELRKEWKQRHDKVGLAIGLAFWAFLTYLAVSTMVTIHGGTLPPNIIEHAWTEKVWAPLVYFGAVMCPTIYASIYYLRRKGKKEELR